MHRYLLTLLLATLFAAGAWSQDSESGEDEDSVDTPAESQFGPERGNSFVIRGSSWRHASMTELRLSYRDYGSEARPDIGFRLARNAD